jgi:uncharacterized coiled-coil protein SlyX
MRAAGFLRAAMIMVVMVGAGFPCLGQQEVIGRIAQLESEVAQQQTTINNLTTQINSLQAQIISLSGLQTEVNRLSSELASLSTMVYNLSASMGGMLPIPPGGTQAIPPAVPQGIPPATSSRSSDITALQNRLSELNCIRRSGSDLIFSGVNVHISAGSVADTDE